MNSYALLIRGTHDSINNLKIPEGHLHYIPMEWKESIKATTVNLLAHPTGGMFPFLKKAKAGRAKKQSSKCQQKSYYNENMLII